MILHRAIIISNNYETKNFNLIIFNYNLLKKEKMTTFNDFSIKTNLAKLVDVLNEAKQDYETDRNLFCKTKIFFKCFRKSI